MQSRLGEMRALNSAIFAISVDTPEQNKEVVEANNLSFRILSDPDGKAMDAFGVRHKGAWMGKDIARPAVFIIDRNGKVAWKAVTDNWRVRVRPEEVLDQLRNLQ